MKKHLLHGGKVVIGPEDPKDEFSDPLDFLLSSISDENVYNDWDQFLSWLKSVEVSEAVRKVCESATSFIDSEIAAGLSFRESLERDVLKVRAHLARRFAGNLQAFVIGLHRGNRGKVLMRESIREIAYGIDDTEGMLRGIGEKATKSDELSDLEKTEVHQSIHDVLEYMQLLDQAHINLQTTFIEVNRRESQATSISDFALYKRPNQHGSSRTLRPGRTVVSNILSAQSASRQAVVEDNGKMWPIEPPPPSH